MPKQTIEFTRGNFEKALRQTRAHCDHYCYYFNDKGNPMYSNPDDCSQELCPNHSVRLGPDALEPEPEILPPPPMKEVIDFAGMGRAKERRELVKAFAVALVHGIRAVDMTYDHEIRTIDVANNLAEHVLNDLDAEGSEADEAEAQHLLAAYRNLVPEAFGSGFEFGWNSERSSADAWEKSPVKKKLDALDKVAANANLGEAKGEADE